MKCEDDFFVHAAPSRVMLGAELMNYISSSEVQTAFVAKLAPGGSEDISTRIQKYYDIPKSLPAQYIPRFVELAKLTESARSFISILAPHTHWQFARPIIYKFNRIENRYIVGLHDVNAEDQYRPVSFIVNKGRVFCYEWVDKSVPINEINWQSAVTKIHQVLLHSVKDDEPVGLGMDFRFRDAVASDGLG